MTSEQKCWPFWAKNVFRTEMFSTRANKAFRTEMFEHNLHVLKYSEWPWRAIRKQKVCFPPDSGSCTTGDGDSKWVIGIMIRVRGLVSQVGVGRYGRPPGCIRPLHSAALSLFYALCVVLDIRLRSRLCGKLWKYVMGFHMSFGGETSAFSHYSCHANGKC